MTADSLQKQMRLPISISEAEGNIPSAVIPAKAGIQGRAANC
jgi:hypothetical protein